MAKLIKKSSKPVYDDKKELLIQDLIEVLEKLDFTVRVEKGIFKGGFCLLREQKVFLLNKNLEQEKKISILVKNIAESDSDNIFLKPNIRELVDREKGNEKLL
ncbi:MAG: hypothetical protein IPH77_05140 [Ignavibacteria bacterium]|nr:hypothetical protein [Ignavibacteria bacterium]MBK6771103.1 hypothetical protein [Ignavibacteria bacterium]MBK7157944.1 hypothetical protein [Ignavibacteria bacterium]MBK7253922.1 hypothetical protein [Ignavibacteria bacterium]MBK7445432.1 hypothetical protein [Ignavibacteria bacterium]